MAPRAGPLPGAAPGEEESVFECFHRGRAGRTGPPGTGLGLPIAGELAGQWEATVSRDAPVGGARAVVRFAAGSVRAAREPALEEVT